MERPGLSALKWIIALSLACITEATFCQSRVSDFYSMIPQPTTLKPPIVNWFNDPAMFLEANRFSVDKELKDRYLWLEAGYGAPILNTKFPEPFYTFSSGIEGLAWSRLRVLSDFRFPVETVDYYFGLFFLVNRADLPYNWRFRIGHISSHEVDGLDSVAAGSSSHYSREFAELTWQVQPDYDWNPKFVVSIGLRGYFHQVTSIEPWIGVPFSFAWCFLGTIPSGVSLFVSTGDGPIWPTYSGGLRFEHRVESNSGLSTDAFDLQLYYQYGASWAGTDAGAKRSTVNLQLDVRDF